MCLLNLENVNGHTCSADTTLQEIRKYPFFVVAELLQKQYSKMVKSPGSGARFLGFVTWLSHFLAKGP